MAVLDSYVAFDQRSVTLGNIWQFSTATTFYYDQQFVDFDYSDYPWNCAYVIDYELEGALLTAEFGGDFIEVSDIDLSITGGSFEYFQVFSSDGTNELFIKIEDFTISAVKVFQAMVTPEIEDDRQIIAEILSGNDDLLLSDYNDFAQGFSGSDSMIGYGGNDTLSGGSGADTLKGGEGSDTLSGGSAGDRLFGNAGKDALIGGFGNDAFVFERSTDSDASIATADVIRDFVRGEDKIELKSIDAFAGTATNDTFLWRGTSGFSSSTAGEVRYKKYDNDGTSNDYTMVFIDNDADTTVEMSIRVNGLHNFTSSDFIL